MVFMFNYSYILLLKYFRYFAQGQRQSTIAHNYRLAKNEFANIIQQVSNAIMKEFGGEFMEFSEMNWAKVANEFNHKWQLPNCAGAIDGQHVAIRKPHNAGSDYFNFKRFHSIILMACVDANLKFITIDVGGKGAEGDAAVFNRIVLGRMIKENSPELHFPPDAPIGEKLIPYYLVADDVFPLLRRLMKPYKPTRNEPLTVEEALFNYRLSRARRCVESAFGLLGMKWPCVDSTFRCQPDKVRPIVAACCVLHNFLLNRTPETYIPDQFKDYYNDDGQFILAEWRQTISQNYDATQTVDPKDIRNAIKNFVNSPEGELPFQNRAAGIEI